LNKEGEKAKKVIAIIPPSQNLSVDFSEWITGVTGLVGLDWPDLAGTEGVLWGAFIFFVPVLLTDA
jgi:hypothetical protein